MGLQICKNDYQVKEAIVGCYKDNIGSKKAILANGGKLQKEIIEEDGLVSLVYTIDLGR